MFILNNFNNIDNRSMVWHTTSKDTCDSIYKSVSLRKLMGIHVKQKRTNMMFRQSITTKTRFCVFLFAITSPDDFTQIEKQHINVR